MRSLVFPFPCIVSSELSYPDFGDQSDAVGIRENNREKKERKKRAEGLFHARGAASWRNYYPFVQSINKEKCNDSRKTPLLTKKAVNINDVLQG